MLAAAMSVVAPSPASAQAGNPDKVVDLGVYPPWQGGRNNDAIQRGLEFTIADADNLADFHGDPQNPLLSLYVGGNYFFAMAPLVAAFEQRYPEYRGRLYWETIPPGLLVRQMKAGGTITVGNMTWTVKPDVYLAGKDAVERQVTDGLLVGPVVPYVTNTLAIMVPKGNPAKVTGLASLGDPTIRLAMPNPEFEGVARQISAALEEAGGKPLADKVYKTKVADGTAVLTHIHHRQTPLWLMQGKAQAGVTWQSEVAFQMQAGHPIEGVEIPAAQNQTAVYAAAIAKDAPHPEAAKRWLDFIRSPQALAIFAGYGFKPYRDAHK